MQRHNPVHLIYAKAESTKRAVWWATERTDIADQDLLWLLSSITTGWVRSAKILSPMTYSWYLMRAKTNTSLQSGHWVQMHTYCGVWIVGGLTEKASIYKDLKLLQLEREIDPEANLMQLGLCSPAETATVGLCVWFHGEIWETLVWLKHVTKNAKATAV